MKPRGLSQTRACRMALRYYRRTVIVGLCFGLSTIGRADGPSTGPAGINSQILNDQYGLTGNGITIGMVEWSRPGMPGFDSAANSHPDVKPAAVFFRDGAPPANTNITNHAFYVSGGLISSHPVHRSVSPGASLLASGTGDLNPPDIDRITLRSMQHLALMNEGDVRTIQVLNVPLSGSIPRTGNTLGALGLDWLARQHDTLYPGARGNAGVAESGVGLDNFNGVIVGGSQKNSQGVYSQLWPGTFSGNATDGRRLTSFIAPAVGLTVPVRGGSYSTPGPGTTHATWHTTGTSALLQQYADTQIAGQADGWTADAQRHEVIKAVLMTSTDKLQDTGDGRLLDMQKAILRRNGSNWTTASPAAATRTIPLDDDLGTGQLNAYRALAQFAAGQAGPGVVPAIGWDYGATNGPDQFSKYTFTNSLIADSYVSVSLAWDRLIDLNDANTNGMYDIGEEFTSRGMSNLDLFLLPKGAADTGQALWSSESTLYNVEHMFFKVPTACEYEFWVRQNGPSPHADGQQPYAVAWQALAGAIWSADADGAWSAAANWNGSVPNLAGSVVILGGATTQPRTVTLDSPITVGRVNFESGQPYTIAGTNPLTLDLTVGDAQIFVGAGNHTISAPVTLANPTIINVAGPTSSLSMTGALNVTGVRLTKSGAGVLTVNNVRVATLSLNGGTLAIAPNPTDAGTSQVSALSIAGTTTPAARLDLNDNALVVDYTGTSPVATVRQRIVAGRGGAGLGKTWNGPGITSSAAAAADPESRSVGYAENSALPLGPYTEFRGQAVDDTSVLMAFTRTGDANLDGIVNDDDVTIVSAAYAPGVPNPHWAVGDFDYNGFVDDDDLTLLGAFYDPSATPLFAPAAANTGHATAVPEPATLALLLTGLIAMLLRHNRRRTYRDADWQRLTRTPLDNRASYSVYTDDH
ncbi:MAG: PEP-CTERM sorting domain-containing protein [Pirellulales bacterium]